MVKMPVVKMPDDKMADDRNVIGEKPLIAQPEKYPCVPKNTFN